MFATMNGPRACFTINIYASKGTKFNKDRGRARPDYLCESCCPEGALLGILEETTLLVLGTKLL